MSRERRLHRAQETGCDAACGAAGHCGHAEAGGVVGRREHVVADAVAKVYGSTTFWTNEAVAWRGLGMGSCSPNSVEACEKFLVIHAKSVCAGVLMTFPHN